MKQHSKLSTEQKQEHVAEQTTGQQAAHEFVNAEEILRYDAAQTPVPPGIVQRLAKSSAQLPNPSRSWWQRFFGGSKS